MRIEFKLDEIDHQVLKFIVGMIAILLPPLVSCFAGESLDSISESYHTADPARNIFVGFLFAISSFLFAYNGKSQPEFLMSKAAALAALGVALFPCGCERHTEKLINVVHFGSAGVMFTVLAGMCEVFRRRALDKHTPEGLRRARIYRTCTITIVGSMVLLLAHVGFGCFNGWGFEPVYWFEASSLWAFGIAWLTAAKPLDVIAEPGQKVNLKLFRF